MTTRDDINPPIARATEAFNNHDVDGYVAEFAEEGTFFDPKRGSRTCTARVRALSDPWESGGDINPLV